MSPRATYVALLHHPMRDRTGAEVTTALTTLDLHDMARTCRTYDIARFYIVHPLEPQRAIATRILRHWEGDSARHDFRGEALRRARIVVTLDDALTDIATDAGARPRILATTAKQVPDSLPLSDVRAYPGPQLLLFGTGFGMADELLARADHVLPAIAPPSVDTDGGEHASYNHLSVRSACAILLDRLYGDGRDCPAFEQHR